MVCSFIASVSFKHTNKNTILDIFIGTLVGK
jgi:hypothetical protein